MVLFKFLWDEYVLQSLCYKLTEELSTVAYYQILIVGTFFDAKHQLETQRLFQELQAQSHKDYHPSVGMCEFGTNIRSLAASDNNANFNQIAFSARGLQRQLLSGNTLGAEGQQSDIVSRLVQFREVYCNPADNGNGLALLCQTGGNLNRANKDVNFNLTVDTPLTLDVDFSFDAIGITNDETDVLALSANLYGHTIMPHIPPSLLDTDAEDQIEAPLLYGDARAIAAKRSVAQAAYAAQTAMRSQGEAEVMPYLQAILEQMGITPEEAALLIGGRTGDDGTTIGERPSYHAQMEILTKKIYQNPDFYTNLYDKPVNIDRKEVAMRAIGLMQKRDIYRSQLRSEAIMSVWLETMVDELQEYYANEAAKAKEDGEVIILP